MVGHNAFLRWSAVRKVGTANLSFIGWMRRVNTADSAALDVCRPRPLCLLSVLSKLDSDKRIDKYSCCIDC